MGIHVKQAYEGITYLDFPIKSCGYVVKEWGWLIEKFKAKIYKWSH